MDSGRTAALTPERLRAMIDAYYDARGLDADGVPAPATLAALDVEPLDTLVH
jgi:hypothetical protein